MANMLITQTSKFEPFTYERYLLPVLAYTESYDKALEDYLNLITQGESFKQYAAQILNPEAYSRYSQYMADLKAASDAMASGLNSNAAFKALTDLKLRYANEITPIQKASESLKESDKTRLTIKLKSPSAIFKNNNQTIDSRLNGESINDEYVIGEDLTKKASSEIEAYINSTIDEDELRSMINSNKKGFVLSKGYTSEELNKVFDENIADEDLPDTLKPIRELYNRNIESSGYYDFDELGKTKIKDAIKTGIMKGGLKLHALEYNKNYDRPQRTSSSNNTSPLFNGLTMIDNDGDVVIKNGGRWWKIKPDGTLSPANMGTRQPEDEKPLLDTGLKQVEKLLSTLNYRIDNNGQVTTPSPAFFYIATEVEDGKAVKKLSWVPGETASNIPPDKIITSDSSVYEMVQEYSDKYLDKIPLNTILQYFTVQHYPATRKVVLLPKNDEIKNFYNSINSPKKITTQTKKTSQSTDSNNNGIIVDDIINALNTADILNMLGAQK